MEERPGSIRKVEEHTNCRSDFEEELSLSVWNESKQVQFKLALRRNVLIINSMSSDGQEWLATAPSLHLNKFTFKQTHPPFGRQN